MKDPYIDSDGNSYDWETIQEWLHLNPFSPFTRNPLNITNLVPNRALKVVIDEFVRFGFKFDILLKKYESLKCILGVGRLKKDLKIVALLVRKLLRWDQLQVKSK
jgi:hypothetical protein